MDPPAFFARAAGLPADRLVFRHWLDTRAVPLPHEPAGTIIDLLVS